MESRQRRFLQVILFLLGPALFAASWKILPADSFWLPYSYRIVMDASGGRQWGLESRFHNLGTSILLGFVAPVLCWAIAGFLQFSKTSRS